MEPYNQLIKTLDRFIRRFYLNQLLRGGIFLLTGIAALILILSLSEYFFYLHSWMKISILSIITLITFYALIFWVIRPLLGMQRIGKIISREQAATIIGRFFPEVKDKLLNILQLHEQSHAGESAELAIAGIEQKAAQLTVLPLLNAVNLKNNKRYLIWLIPSILLIGGIAIIWPQVFKDSAFRLSQPTKNFYPPAPFQFVLTNKNLQVPLNGHYKIQLSIVGKKLPAQVSVVIEGQGLIMKPEVKDKYSYTLNHVTANTKFYFTAAGFRSADYELNILERPQLEKLVLQLNYPPYTRLKEETQQGFSNISVPEGTRLAWQLTTKNTEEMDIRFPGNNRIILRDKNNNNSWTYTMSAKADSTITFILSNLKLPHFDSLSYNLHVIKDNAPQVSAHQDKDTISGRQILLTGIASDDYGLSKLHFHYAISNPDHTLLEEHSIPIQPTHDAKSLNYSYYFDVGHFHLMPGQILNYYIAAWDNDAIHGPKKGISELFSYRQKNNTQLEKAIQENNMAINQQISNSTDKVENINKDIEKFREQMLQTPGMSWEQQNQLKSLTEKQEALQDKINALKRRFEQQQRQSEEKQYSENIKEKQKELEKQLDKVQNKDLADMIKKLQEMLQQKNKDNTFQQLKQWQEQNKLFQMDMERIQALMKQLALQMKMEDLAQKAKDLAKAQNRLADQTNNPKENASNLNNEQKELAKQLDDLMKNDLQELDKANQGTENPQDLTAPEEEGQQAQQEMQNSRNSLNQNQRNKAGSQQKNAAQNLEQMSASLMKMAGGMDMQIVDINIKATRQLLSNLIRYSFAQEDLLKAEKEVVTNQQIFDKQLEKQHTLKQNSEMIKDSLFSLSKRIFQLAPSINKETSELTGNLDKALSYLEDRRIREARVSQQFAMSNANNLALMLDETLSHLMQMQMQAQGQQGGQGMPSSGKPGAKGKGNSPGQMMQDIITGQQQMGKGMSQMQGQGQKGQSGQSGKGQQQGQNGDGKENGGSGDKQAERLVRLTQQQAEIRNMMQDLSSMLNSQGNGQNSRLIKEIQKAMNQNETDLVNRRLNTTLFQRQQEIMTRLLQAQDAIRNQEQDNKRIAETANDVPPPMPPELKEIMEKRKAFLESYQTIPASLNPFYKQMTEQYQKQINGQ